jgi:hypothetical protein
MPDWDWAEYFKEIKLGEPGDINVHQPDFLKAANEVFKATSIDDWKTYLRWHLINATAPELSKDFVNEDFNFKETTLRGTKQIKPRWKRVVIATDAEIGEALGKLYVADYFPPEAKARALELINNLKEALSDRIKTLEWMDEPTKQEAFKKAGGDDGEDWLSRQMARLFPAQDRSRPVRAQHTAGGKFRIQPRPEKDRQTDRSHGVGHDSSNGECVLQSGEQRDRFPGRDFTTAILQSGGGRCDKLRRYWRGHRA